MNVQIPFLYKPRDYQLAFWKAMDNGCKRAVLVWSRRSGKDKTSWNFTIREALKKKGTYFYMLPEYEHARKVIWDAIDKEGIRFLDHVPKEIVSGKNESEMKITLVNGSIIKLVGSDSYDSLVGTNPMGVVFSEYSIGDGRAWDFIRPILAENGGWAVFNFTPRGMNHGWKILQQARNEPEQWFHQVLTVDDTKCISPEVLESERKQMPEELFRQEYYCEFLDGAGAFFTRINENLWDGEMMIEMGKSYQLGVDLGKHMDFTVITPVDLHTNRVGKPERFNQMDWVLQKSKIETAYHRYNKARIVMDSTGIGDPIYDDLSVKINIEPFKFTQTTRMDLLNNLRLKLAQDDIKIPNDENLINELRSFQYSLNDHGKITVKVPDGVHDDCVFSLALAVWGLGQPQPYHGKDTNEGWGIYDIQKYD